MLLGLLGGLYVVLFADWKLQLILGNFQVDFAPIAGGVAGSAIGVLVGLLIGQGIRRLMVRNLVFLVIGGAVGWSLMHLVELLLITLPNRPHVPFYLGSFISGAVGFVIGGNIALLHTFGKAIGRASQLGKAIVNLTYLNVGVAIGGSTVEFIWVPLKYLRSWYWHLHGMYYWDWLGWGVPGVIFAWALGLLMGLLCMSALGRIMGTVVAMIACSRDTEETCKI